MGRRSLTSESKHGVGKYLQDIHLMLLLLLLSQFSRVRLCATP